MLGGKMTLYLIKRNRKTLRTNFIPVRDFQGWILIELNQKDTYMYSALTC